MKITAQMKVELWNKCRFRDVETNVFIQVRLRDGTIDVGTQAVVGDMDGRVTYEFRRNGLKRDRKSGGGGVGTMTKETQ